jgi:VanZ family protein
MNKRKKLLAWLWVSLCSLAIFLIVPIARTIEKFVSAHWGRSLFGYAVLAAVGVAFLFLLHFLVFKLKIRSPSNYIWLTAVAGLYVYFTLKLWRAPEQAIHFLEYGVLGYFLFRALSLSLQEKGIYLVAFLSGSLVGIFDEILQWMIPERYFDFRDIVLNALAVGLFQVALWKGIKPKIIGERIGRKSIRTTSLLFAVNLLLLGACASNTPDRVAQYVERFPLLSWLLKEEPMNEFTQKHEDPDVGIFYSRLSVDLLKQTDEVQGDHYAQVLRDWNDKDYAQFLSMHNPLIHPFLYEMRVHIFRRDKKEEEAEKARNEKARREAIFVSYKENLILEKYFTSALRKSSYAWSPAKKKSIEALVDKAKPYRSPVSAGFFRITEKTVWLTIILILIALAVVNYFISFVFFPKYRR